MQPSETTPARPEMKPHSAHWGAFSAAWDGRELKVRPHPRDPDPNPIIDNLIDALRHPVRIARPMVRRGWLENGPGPDARRGSDDHVEMDWDEVLDRLASELRRVQQTHGCEAIFGGSYGWSSAGRFHHAQSQVHRFLNTALGGYVRSVNTYSAGAAAPLLPHVIGTMEQIARQNVTLEQLAEHTEIVLSFGGMALKNSRVASGGVSQHKERGAMEAAAQRGCRFINISPLRDDLPDEINAEWIAPVPMTDTALMLAIVHQLWQDDTLDRDFIARYCDGWNTFEDYLLGRSDGVVKSCAWAARICDVPERRITELARSLVGKRVLITVSHSLQRSEHGEQPVWMGAVLAAALGQLGLPGGGYNYALGTLAHYGRRNNAWPVAPLPQGSNSVKAFIPVARIADMLLHPGEPFDYDGQRMTYPHIRLAYWAGGNPFHHHQDLRRLSRAFQTLDTFIVNESVWTATARHADIVLPTTLTLERDDIGATSTDPLVIAMKRIAEPFGESRDDYAIFSDLAERLGKREAFTEGRDTRQWLAHLYEHARRGIEKTGPQSAPSFEEFWDQGELLIPQLPDDGGLLRAFRNDPEGTPLPTPSGKVQISSPIIASFGYPDCPGHPAHLPPQHAPTEEHPLWLIANQPYTKLHSQLDFGRYSMDNKRQGREICRLHPDTAAARGIKEGDIIQLHNELGACLASAHLSEEVRKDVVQLPTGAWYDPRPDARHGVICVHGNPNIVARDLGTSALGQGCAGQISTVQVERYDAPLPPIRAFDPPAT
ncbi:molybdopterin-dependent oxidoreductase [Diaphorobacter caeni]|uniref:molybdopterin-dependent oxidoreductase n=1 Tax=Diaphorobacter caeni TaxID=2784387 RepID=UPI0018909F96|nr:molybdopterin-dependent oxidoreductase [Diaphorobacter caeni]MBF5005415.1 molybdopterin-dependent oxidoreductase [Diaphorobacter caeni]